MRFGVLEHTVDSVRNEVFDGVQELFEVDERSFGLDVRVLGQVATSPRRLGAIRLSNAENVAESGARRLQVELRRLGQVGLLAEVVELEESRATFHLRLHQSWRKALEYATNKNTIMYIIDDEDKRR